jgi:hypothetical protein
MAGTDLTAQRLRELLHYDPETGIFTRAVSRQGRNGLAGCVAGGKTESGYIRISLYNRLHRAHRLAWLYMFGDWPSGDIDHINGIRGDNRIENLRDVSTSVNMQNQREAQPRNASGFLGVTIHGSRFEASIKLNGKNIYLGSYKTPELAHAAYLEKKRGIHPGCCI